MNKMNTLAFVNFFTRQTFPNPDSSKFSTVKNLCHTVRRNNFAFHCKLACNPQKEAVA